MVPALIFSYVWSTFLLFAITSGSRTVGLRTTFAAMLCGASFSTPVAVALQYLVLHATGGDLNALGYTVDPAIEELLKLAPVFVVLLGAQARRDLRASDYVLLAGAAGSGFGLVESLLRFGMSPVPADPDGGWTLGFLASVHLPSPWQVVTGWFVSVAPSGGVLHHPINSHLAWSALAGLGLYWLLSPRMGRPYRIAGAVGIWLAWGYHAAFNGALSYPTTFTRILSYTIGLTLWLTVWLPALATIGAFLTDLVIRGRGVLNGLPLRRRPDGRHLPGVGRIASRFIRRCKEWPSSLRARIRSDPWSMAVLALPLLFFVIGGFAGTHAVQQVLASGWMKPALIALSLLAIARVAVVLLPLRRSITFAMALGVDPSARLRITLASFAGSTTSTLYAICLALVSDTTWAHGQSTLHVITALLVAAGALLLATGIGEIAAGLMLLGEFTDFAMAGMAGIAAVSADATAVNMVGAGLIDAAVGSAVMSVGSEGEDRAGSEDGATAGSEAPNHIESRGPYSYEFDDKGRTALVKGRLTRNAMQGRNTAAQRAAGGADRLSTDEGGHFIGRRFDGPLDAFNHFAQDMNLNRGKYKALENLWDKTIKEGKTVDVEIRPSYAGQSFRPYSLDIEYEIDGIPASRSFLNQRGG